MGSKEETLADAILETVQLPILALDGDLRVETANDAFLRQFQVEREETLGRLVYELGNGQWDIPDLRRLLSEILPERTTVTDYRVVHDFERIGLRIMHLSARRIVRSGGRDLILLAISDDTERESLRAEMIGRIELADKLIDSVREGLLILDPDLRVQSASNSFYETFGVEPGQTIGRLVYELGNGQWDIPELRKLLEDVLPNQQSFDDYQVTHRFEGIGERVMLLNGRRLDHMDLILLAIRDVTDIRESRARLTDVARAARIGIFEGDRSSGTLYWSTEFRDIIGYPQEQAPPKSAVPDFVHPVDRTAVARTFEAALDPAGDGAINSEHRIVRPDEEMRWVQMHGRAEFADVDGERRAVRVRGVLLDVTEQKVAQARLREYEQRQGFLLSLSDAIRAQETSDDIAAAGLRLLREHLGVDRTYVASIHGSEPVRIVAEESNAELPAMPQELLPSDFPDGLRRAAEGIMIVPDIWTDEDLTELDRRSLDRIALTSLIVAPLHRGAKGMIWALVAGSRSPRVWAEGEASLLAEAAERIWAGMERARADAALRASEARYRQLFDSIDEGFCLVEVSLEGDRIDYRVVEANPAFYEKTGFPKSIFGRWLRKAAPDLEEHWYETYGRVARTGEAVRFVRSSDLLGRWFEVYAFRFGAPEDRRVAILFNEISERKRAEAHQNMLMAELDHRVKNILAVVQSIARQSLGEGHQGGPEAEDRLVGRIGALAKSHALLARSRWEGAQFRDLVEDSVAPYRGERSDRVIVEGPDLTVTPKAAQSLTLVLHELVTNAAKYGALSREDGQVTAEWHLSGDEADRRLVFAWQEHGGPPIKVAPSRKGFGSRLIEMTLTYELAGEVTQEFARDGLRAVIILPLSGIGADGERKSTHPGERVKRAAANPATLRGCTVLVVEDEYLVGQETADVLRSAGCSVAGPVATMQEALRIAASEALDAALLDINLNGEMVWPAAHALNARGIPFMFTTGYSDTIEIPPGLDQAPRAEKPIQPDRLIATLAATVTAPAAPFRAK